MTGGPPPAAWLPDPWDAHELRYWDGQGWTGHVADHGVAATAAMEGSAPTGGPPAHAPPRAGGGTLFAEPVLIVGRDFNIFTKTISGSIRSGSGQLLAKAAEGLPSAGALAFNLFVFDRTEFQDHFITVADPRGAALFHAQRRGVLAGAGPAVVRDPAGRVIGQLTRGRGTHIIDLWSPTGFEGHFEGQPPAFRDPSGTLIADAIDMPDGITAPWIAEGRQHYVMRVDRPLTGPAGVLVIAALLYLGF